MVVAKLLLLALVVFVLSSGAAAEEFFWPLRLEPALSATFAERRATAFHAGMDVKTWGKTGYEVQAIAAGYIWRVRTSPWGYGRAIYLKLVDGRTVVYGHLERFAPKIADRVLQAQAQRGRYTVDLYFNDEDLPVQGGDLIGWSGESGGIPPHLHLELRDADNVPLNPLLHGFTLADTIAPTLQRIAITPYGSGAQVEGGHDPHIIGLRFRPDRGEFTATDAIQVRGWVGIAALTYDRADGAPNKLAPYSIVLELDGRQVFAAHYDQVAFGDMHQVNLDRSGDRGRFFNLYRLPGNRLGFYQGRGNGLLNAGKGALGKGLHEAVVLVADVNGNESRARLRLLVDAAPQITKARISTTADGVYVIEAELSDEDDSVVEVELASSLDGETWREVDRRQSRLGELKWRIHRNATYWRIRALDPAGEEALAICRLPALAKDKNEEDAIEAEVAAPSFTVERHPHQDFVELVLHYDEVPSAAPLVWVGSTKLNPRQADLREYRVAVQHKPGDTPQIPVTLQSQGAEAQQVLLDRQWVRPGTAKDLEYGGGRVSLRFAEASVYTPFFPQVEAFEPQVPEHLVVAGPAFALGPELSFDRKVELGLRYEGGAWPPEKLGIYMEVADKKWVMVGNEWDAMSGQVGAKLRTLGRYALLADLTAPEIDALQPATGAVVTQRPKISAAISDAGAGIGREEDIELELDGRSIIAEYVLGADMVQGLLLADLTPGPHRLVVRVRDMSGNQAEARSEFEVR